ncbi:hypothetical protein WAZ07_21680 [Bacillus sp. FJAT-51639]|uniref:HTH merR-type domain-containing protein n=1 Tax=Bacillus bruguierae TaxID=3127667 RepID=A0ABU8FM84_9BACI
MVTIGDVKQATGLSERAIRHYCDLNTLKLPYECNEKYINKW